MRSRSVGDFPKTHFTGGANLDRGKGPTLVELLNVVNKGFFDGIISVDDSKPEIDFLFRAKCPFNGDDLHGRYLLDLALYDLTESDSHPIAGKVRFDKDAIFGEIVKRIGPRITVATDSNGQFGGRIVQTKGVTNIARFIVATTHVKEDAFFVATDKTWLVQPVISKPFTFA